MTNSNSIVSVVIPCFNQGVFLDQSLRSISEQTFSSWECIIVNDGSTDETGKVAMEWVQKDSRFKYFSIPNGGVSNARNFGIGNAHGTYILPLDADDRIGPRYLEKAVALLDNNTEIHVVYSEAEFFGERQEDGSCLLLMSTECFLKIWCFVPHFSEKLILKRSEVTKLI